MTTSRADVVIAGAGPAGSTAAILLARAGARVVLVDKARFPRDKLCGEFVSPEAVSVLARTGVLARLAPTAGRAGEVLLTDPTGAHLRLPIPAPEGAPTHALGIPRREMDAALVEEAARVGVEIVENFTVRSLLFTRERATGVSGTDRGGGNQREFEAGLLIAADGRDSTLARLLSPSDFLGRSSPRFGLKAHFSAPSGFGGAIELHYFRGGYLGLHDVGGGRMNACALIDRSVAGTIPADPESIVRDIFFRNPAVRERLRTAERISDWLAVGSLVFRREAPVRSGVLFLGDAAGTIDPFAGEGMSMALRSAEIASDEILRAHGSEGAACATPRGVGALADSSRAEPLHAGSHSAPDAIAAAYARRWNREFARRIAICRTLGRIAIRPVFQAPLIGILGRFPSLGSRLAYTTRTGVAASSSPHSP